MTIRLSASEHADITAAAGLLGLSAAAYAAEVTLGVARRTPSFSSPLRELLETLIRATVPVTKAGIAVERAVALSEAAGCPTAELLPAHAGCLRTLRNLDDVAEAIRKRLG